MNDLKTEDVAALLELLKDSGFDELHVENDGFEIYIARSGVSSRRLMHLPASTISASVPALERAQAPAATPAVDRTDEKAAPRVEAGAGQIAAGAQQITSPLMGTFYRAPSPDAPPFVEVGQEVTPETTIAIVEVMKLMNQVPAGVSGVVEKILVEDGTLVEFGQPLMLVSAKRG